MKNLVLSKVFFMILAVGFVSCGDDPGPPDYDKGNLIGSYVGNCVVELGTKSEVFSNFPVEFKQRDTNSLSLDLGNETTYKSIGVSIIKTATKFKDHKNYARFNIESINVDFSADQIPDFFKDNMDLSFEVKKATLKLNSDSKNPPTFTKTSRILTFTYTGSIEIIGNSSKDKISRSITYSVNVNKVR